MRRLLISIAAASVMLAADGVMISPSGKSYHKLDAKCIGARRATKLIETTEAAAQAKKLVPCKVCYRTKGTK